MKTKVKTNVQVKVDEDIKIQLKEILDELGLNITDAVNLFFHEIVRTKKIPVTLDLSDNKNIFEEIASEELEKELKHAYKDYINGRYTILSSPEDIDEHFKDL